jgi:hypothetical protein
MVPRRCTNLLININITHTWRFPLRVSILTTYHLVMDLRIRIMDLRHLIINSNLLRAIPCHLLKDLLALVLHHQREPQPQLPAELLANRRRLPKRLLLETVTRRGESCGFRRVIIVVDVLGKM